MILYRTSCFYHFFVLFNLSTIISAQNYWKVKQIEDRAPPEELKIIWCTVSVNETNKCLAFSQANERDQVKVGYDTIQIECKQASNKDDCMTMLDEEKATMTTLDSGEIFVGGRYRSLVPIAQEVLEGGFNYYYAVAVVKAGGLSDVFSLRDLKGKRSCFAGVETFAGWMLPISTLMKNGIMEIVDCNNHVKTATNFFGPSCAANCLSDKYNPIGDNSDKLCQLCVGEIPGRWCTDADPYAGYDGAFRCLLEKGEIAFLKHTTIPELLKTREFAGIRPDQFELLCKDGTHKPLSEYPNCNWGKSPTNAIAVSSAVSFETREKFQKFLQKFAEKYGKNSNRPSYSTEATLDYDSSGNKIYSQDQFDQYGNKIRDSGSDQSTIKPNQIDYDQYGNRPEYDQFRNSGGRYKRQDRYQGNYNRNDYDRQNQGYYNRDQDRYGQQNYNRDQYGQDLSNNGYGSDGYQNNNDANSFNRNRTGDFAYYEYFDMFESTPRYGDHANLIFQDSSVGISAVPENLQTYKSFLGETHEIIMGVRDCPVQKMTLCVTSDAEKNKCVKMRTALKAQLLMPEMECYKGHSQIHCMQAIRSGTADVTVLDASDVYTAGLNFDLIPFISEVYNLEDADYYVVAVAKESDPDTELTYLRSALEKILIILISKRAIMIGAFLAKNTCHGGISTAAGWVYPLAFLISNGWIRPYGCNSIRAAAEYFTKSCTPGAISTEYNTGVPYDNMCDLCHGPSYRHCRRDASEDYYGHTGAFRCLVEGGGHVAFVKHTTVYENTGGKKREWWVRDNLVEDFELLCPDGTRAEVSDFRKCNLGKVKANAIVTRGGYGYNETQLNAYINLFLYAQTFYGRKTADEFSFSMFTSEPPFADLIFQDATTQLKVIEPGKRYYSSYVGSDFMRARRIVDCHASAPSVVSSLGLLIVTAICMLIFK